MSLQNNVNLGFVSYIGICADALTRAGYSPSDSKSIISTKLLEEAMTLSIKEDGSYDYKTLLPIFKTLKHIFLKEKSVKINDAYAPQIANDISKMDFVINYLDSRINAIEKNL